MPVNIILHGASGRMGREVARLVLAAPDRFTIAGCVEPAGSPAVGNDIGTLCGGGVVGVRVKSELRVPAGAGAVVIDFSAPEALSSLLESVSGTGTGLVVGTTGLSASHMEMLERASADHPVVNSPNMSLGVNILFYLTRIAAARLADHFDIEIVEAHHRFKKDAPSGTARRLGEIAAEALGASYDEVARNGRGGITGERPARQIGMHAIRGGDITGDHTVLFAGTGERIELRHVAHNRQNFAGGALKAAEWLQNKRPGLYTMGDVLGLS